jgi:N-acetylglucosaminyldiphosphoundecaprenol N-acetyl-beta-D-mannosaminyltransferase
MSKLPLRKIKVLGYELIDEPPQHIAAAVCDDLGHGDARGYFFLNPHSIVQAAGDAGLQGCFLDEHAELFCDGVGLSLANRLLNRQPIHRVWGQDFFLAVSRELSDRHQGRVYFLGGHADALESLLAKYRREFSGIAAISGETPPFKPEFSSTDVATMAERINAFRPDVLWIGVGSPKQEKLLRALQPLCRVPCAAAIGAVFDFYGGRVSPGPEWVQRSGLLWAYRLVMEPRRLWRRTLISAPLFVLQVLRELVHQS